MNLPGRVVEFSPLSSGQACIACGYEECIVNDAETGDIYDINDNDVETFKGEDSDVSFCFSCLKTWGVYR